MPRYELFTLLNTASTFRSDFAEIWLDFLGLLSSRVETCFIVFSLLVQHAGGERPLHVFPIADRGKIEDVILSNSGLVLVCRWQ